MRHTSHDHIHTSVEHARAGQSGEFGSYFEAERTVRLGEDHDVVVGDVFLRDLLHVGDDGRHLTTAVVVADGAAPTKHPVKEAPRSKSGVSPGCGSAEEMRGVLRCGSYG